MKLSTIIPALFLILASSTAMAEHKIFQTWDALEGIWITQEPTIPAAKQTAAFQAAYYECLKLQTDINNSPERLGDRYYHLRFKEDWTELRAACTGEASDKEAGQ